MIRYICLFLLVCSAVSAHAQTFDPSLRVGARIGPTITTIEGLSIPQGTALGYTIGLSFSLPVTEACWFQADILYTRKGYRYLYSASPTEINHTVVLHYMDIPLVVRFAPAPVSASNVHIDFGAYMGVLIDGSIDAHIPAELEQTDITEFGMVLGTGIDFTLLRQDLGVDLRYFAALTNDAELYDYPLVPPEPGEPVVYSLNPSSLNHVLSLTASIYF